MGYKNGKDVLPKRLLNELQQYIQGELIYIPKEENTRIGWGESNGTKHFLSTRNTEIYNLYKGGLSVHQLTIKYSLSEDSIRKIISQTNKKVAAKAI